MDPGTALTRFITAFEAVDEVVKACADSGIELVRPRKMLVYRRRLERFLTKNMPAIATLGALPPDAVLELYEAVEAFESPELILQDLMMAGIRGKALTKFRAWENAFDHLVMASTKALQEIED